MIEHLSYSSISLYLDCPEAWRRKYVANEPTRSAPALVFGTAIHGFVEAQVSRQTLAWQAENAVASVPITEAWSFQWNKAIERDGAAIDWGLDTPEQHFNEGLRILEHKDVRGLIDGLSARCDDQGPMIERKVELRVPGVPIPVIGYIDVVAADGTPCDVKTSARAWTTDKAADSLQTLCYLAALNQAGQHWHAWRFRHLVIVKTKEPKVQIIDHTHNPRELFFLFRVIQSVWDGILRGAFPLNPTGWKCSSNWCDFWMQCRGKYA